MHSTSVQQNQHSASPGGSYFGHNMPMTPQTMRSQQEILQVKQTQTDLVGIVESLQAQLQLKDMIIHEL